MLKKYIALLLFAFLSIANAQTVKIILPYAPGGPADQLGRAVHRNLSQRLPHYTFQIESHVGAGGLIASRHVASYTGNDTLLMIHSPALITSSFNDDSGYNLQKDFIPVFNLGYATMVLIANAKGPYNSLDKIIKSDKPMFYGIAGLGGALQLAGETFKRQTRKDMTGVLYKGDSAAVNDVLTNSLSFTFTTFSTVQGMIESPQIVVLGVSGTKRNPKIPTVPTMLEQGIKGFETSHNWMSLFANKTADPEILKELKKALAESYRDPVESLSYAKAGVELDTKNMLQGPEFMALETVRIRNLIEKTQK